MVFFAIKVQKWRVGWARRGAPIVEIADIETSKTFTTEVTKEHRGDRGSEKQNLPRARDTRRTDGTLSAG